MRQVPPLLSRWRRFQLARSLSALLSVCMFPLLAPLAGDGVAYWSLIAGGAAVNFISDKHWSFAKGTRSTVDSTATGTPDRFRHRAPPVRSYG